MKSVRLGPQLEAKLAEASRLTGKSQSEVIREALDRYCDSVGANRLDVRLASFIGVVSGGGPSDTAPRSGELFTEMLLEEHERKAARRADAKRAPR